VGDSPELYRGLDPHGLSGPERAGGAELLPRVLPPGRPLAAGEV